MAISNSFASLQDLIYTNNNTRYMNEHIWMAVYEMYKKVQEKERAFLTRWEGHASNLEIKPIIYYEKYYLDDAC